MFPVIGGRIGFLKGFFEVSSVSDEPSSVVDGELSLTYELVRDTSGFIYDRRFGIGFSMTLGGSGDRPAGTPAPAGFKAQ